MLLKLLNKINGYIKKFNVRPKHREIIFSINKKIWLKKFEIIIRESFFILKNSKFSEKSAQLTYVSILSIVPLIAILFSFIHAFQGFNTIINEFIAPTITKHFGNRAGNEIIEYLNLIISNLKLKELGIISFATFLITVILLVLKIEDNIDEIMEFKNKSKLFNRIVKCWLLLTITPFFFTLASLKSDTFLKLINIQENTFLNSYILHFIRVCLGLSFQWIFFAFIFYIIPSKRVNLRAAFVGGFISNILFEFLQFVNLYFAKRALVTDSSHIYGSVAIIAVLFFVWIRLIWIIILIGASFAIATQKIIFFKELLRVKFSPVKSILDCILIYRTIRNYYRNQNAPIAESFLISSTGIDTIELEHCIQYLLNKNIICSADNELKDPHYLPSYLSILNDKDNPEFLRKVILEDNFIGTKEYKEIEKIFK
ncbi:YhjD/YihY/BrkB family envelope integrity protein [Pigmentibacter ruber]|uniref:YhjD/YihY/BrkB family envelope integrity protein n=1 Tax=Pigmentibacter ruber TaxID=2683196 RepID=UPI00131D7EF6|nr:YhjD/YihY/BrkB family envelope integrity protein [Pigmentibacter ruber]